MSEDKKEKTQEKERKVLKMSDDTIAVVREVVQLSILTGTNLVDHMRAIRLEEIDGNIYPTQEYIDAYNAQIEELAKKAEETQAKMQAQEAGDNEPEGLN